MVVFLKLPFWKNKSYHVFIFSRVTRPDKSSTSQLVWILVFVLLFGKWYHARVPRASGILFFGARNIRIEILQPPCKYIFILCTTQLLTPLKGFGFFIHILKWWYIFFVRLCVQIFHVLVFRISSIVSSGAMVSFNKGKNHRAPDQTILKIKIYYWNMYRGS